MAWWQTQPEAWAATREDQRDPAEALPEYVRWLDSLPGKPVFVAYPAAYDFLFVYWYLICFAGRSPFSHSALDIKTFAMTLLRVDYREASKRRMPARWFPDLPHTHRALDDALEQGRCSATCWPRIGEWSRTSRRLSKTLGAQVQCYRGRPRSSGKGP
jgi:hypothetical protein